LAVAVTNPFWAHITEFSKDCPAEIKQMLYDYTFDDDSEDLAVKGLKIIIDHALAIHRDKTKDGKFFYVCE